MLLVISISILPLSLFHHHDSLKSNYCDNSFRQNEKHSVENETALFTIHAESGYEECLFCTWQMGARLTYVIPEIVAFLPDFVKSRLFEPLSTSVEVLVVTDIPNKGPPDFLLS